MESKPGGRETLKLDGSRLRLHWVKRRLRAFSFVVGFPGDRVDPVMTIVLIVLTGRVGAARPSGDAFRVLQEAPITQGQVQSTGNHGVLVRIPAFPTGIGWRAVCH